MHILLIDDHFCARDGMSELLKQIFPELAVFQADSVAVGLALARQTPFNLLLLDVQMPGVDGLDGLRQFKAEFADLRVVMYSGLDDRELVFEALRLGAMGFIGKNLSRPQFVEALRDVLSGKIYLPPSVIGLNPSASLTPESGLKPASDPAILGLTKREFEVLGWVVSGMCNKSIAANMGISEQTVRNHLRPIFQKLKVSRRTELVVWAFEQGVVFGKPPVGNGVSIAWARA